MKPTSPASKAPSMFMAAAAGPYRPGRTLKVEMAGFLWPSINNILHPWTDTERMQAQGAGNRGSNVLRYILLGFNPSICKLLFVFSAQLDSTLVGGCSPRPLLGLKWLMC